MTRNPAAASGSICLFHPYQNSGKPWRSTTTGPSFGPTATACNPISPLWKASVSRELDLEGNSTCSGGNTPHGNRESEARCAGSGGTHFRSVDTKTQAREVGLAERHEARVEIAPDEEQQERHGGVVFVDDRVGDGHGKIQTEKNLRVRQPACFVLVRFFRERALFAFDPEFGRARKLALFPHHRFDDGLRIAHGDSDSRGHDKGQIEKRALPGFGAKLSLRNEIE